MGFDHAELDRRGLWKHLALHRARLSLFPVPLFQTHPRQGDRSEVGHVDHVAMGTPWEGTIRLVHEGAFHRLWFLNVTRDPSIALNKFLEQVRMLANLIVLARHSVE